VIKNIPPGSFDFGDTALWQMVKVAQDGLRGHDLKDFSKRAGAAAAETVRKLEKKAGEVLAHLIALGTTEGVGVNRNGDGFKRAACRRYHDTFVKHARFFRDHANKPPSPSFGRVVHSDFNEPMDRVELIVGFNETKEAAERNGGRIADKELEKLARGEDIPVSMSCFLDPEYPILTRDRGYVGIADIKVGDYVWTNASRWRKVTQLNRRRYSGETVTVALNGLPVPMRLTADHPLWAKTFPGSRQRAAVGARALRFFRDGAAFESEPAAWHTAGCLAYGDRLFMAPLGKYTGYAALDNADLGALFGYFIAEGSFGYNGDRASTVILTCNAGDSLPRRVPRIVEKLYPDLTVLIRPKANSAAALEVSIYSAELAEWLRTCIRAGSRNKLVPPEIFNAADDVKLACLGAWLDGDGWLDKKGVHWSTVSLGLALQCRDLLLTLGMPASLYRIKHPERVMPGGNVVPPYVEYTVNLAHLDAWRLSEWSEKAAGYQAPVSTRSRPASLRRCQDGRYAVRVKEVTSEIVSDVETYNFEVEEDESYSAAGVISHNCSIEHDVCSGCGNKARTRAEYCDGGMCKYGGLKSNMGRCFDDGHVLHADNPHPDFFDISHVWRPADRIAYVTGLVKAAADSGRVIGGAELAELMGLDEQAHDFAQPGPDAARMFKLAHLLASAEIDIELRPQFYWPLAAGLPRQLAEPSGLVKYAADLAHTLTSLAQVQVVAPLADYAAATLPLSQQANLGPLVVEAASCLPGVYQRLLKQADLESRLSSPLLAQETLPGVAARDWLVKHAAAQSYSSRDVQRRRLAETVQPALRSGPGAVSPEAAQLADGYAIYKLACLARWETEPDFDALARRLVLSHYVAG
jgi:hypothetical protein